METTDLYLKIAGLVIRITVSESCIAVDPVCCKFLTKYEDPDICIEGIVDDRLPDPDRKPVYRDKANIIFGTTRISRYIGHFIDREESSSAKCCIQYDLNEPGFYRLILKKKAGLSVDSIVKSIGIEYLLAQRNRVILHSSYILYKGKGIVFTAPSGTGKSTQADLWKQNRENVEIINGDRSVLSCDGNTPAVHGIPFCGSSGISWNRTAPLQAIVILRQSKGNTIRRLYGAEAVKMIYSECSVSLWDRDCMQNILQVLISITEAVPVFLLACLPDRSAVELLEHALKGEEIYNGE